jgi:hypothetical protein
MSKITPPLLYVIYHNGAIEIENLISKVSLIFSISKSGNKQSWKYVRNINSVCPCSCVRPRGHVEWVKNFGNK